MKNKKLIIASIAFFLIVNTNYYWQGKFGFFSLIIFLILFLVFIVFGFLLLKQIYTAIIEKFQNRSRLLTIGILMTILLLTVIKPSGLVNFEKFESENILIAQREGVANCMTTIKLKKNNTFTEKSVCFGISEINGDYKYRNDTIFFENVNLNLVENEFYKYAIVRTSKLLRDSKHLALARFKNTKDTIGNELFIMKDELTKKPNR